MIKTFLWILLLFNLKCVYSNDTLSILYDTRKIEIDGTLDEWNDIAGITFVDTITKITSIPEYKIESLYPPEFPFNKIKPPISRNKVNIKFIWNMSSLYFAFEVYDEHLYCEEQSEIDKPRLHHNDGIEIYIDTQGEGGLQMDVNDYQFIVDLKNNTQVFRGDRQMIKTDSLAVPKDFDQNVLFKSGVKETMNNNPPGYTCEVSIPFAAIGVEPKTDLTIRLDVCCNDIDYPRSEAIYVERVSTIIWPFNWSGLSDFGYPKYWRPAKLIGGPGWFELISEQYKRLWIYFYIATILISALIIILIITKYRRLKKIPAAAELDPGKFIFIGRKESEINNLSVNQKILLQASDYIALNKNKNIHSEEVARAIGVSLRNFQRITKLELNLTPTQYICIIKLNLAAEFLISRQGNVTAAAYEFGFSDPSYFSKTFKNHFNLSPIEYAKQHPE
jgi:AraC family transcriptional regulator